MEPVRGAAPLEKTIFNASLVGKWPKGAGGPFLTAQMSVFMVFCVPHLPLAFQFVCGPGGGGAANKLEGKWKVSLCLVAPPLAAAVYSANSSFCWRTTFEDICAVRKWSRRPHGVFGREGNVIFAFKMVETEQPPPFSKRRRRQLTNGMFSRRLQPFSNRRRRRRRLTVLNATVVTSRTDVGLLKI